MVQAAQKTVEGPPLLPIDKVVDGLVVAHRQILFSQTIRHSFSTRSATFAEIVEVVEIGALLSAESASPMFVRAPVSEAPPGRKPRPPKTMLLSEECSRSERLCLQNLGFSWSFADGPVVQTFGSSVRLCGGTFCVSVLSTEGTLFLGFHVR